MSAQQACQMTLFLHPRLLKGLGWGLTLAVVAEGHLGLAEANRVFALGDAIELLELRLIDALHSKVRRRPQEGR
jgi:hypothetical protein